MNTSDIPIVILSCERPTELATVLMSLRLQSRAIKASDVYLFQDCGSALAPRCVEVFDHFFKGGSKFVANRNLGVALNYERAETFVFNVLDAPVAYFFEDDLLLGTNYLDQLDQMAGIILADDRIAYAAAYGDHRLSGQSQSERLVDTKVLDHKWGYAVTKRQWSRQKPFMDGYLEIIRGTTYKDRDEQAIRSYFAMHDYGCAGTSQDAAKDVASCVLGTCKINTVACHAKYIGRQGVHMTSDSYALSAYDATSIVDAAPRLQAPSDTDISSWIEAQRDDGRRHLAAFRRSAQIASPVERSRTDIEPSKVTSRPALPAGRIDLKRIDVGMIVRNEMQFLPQSLQALLDAGFDSFIVLDMESSDATRATIGAGAGSRAVIVEYRHSQLAETGFAAARNQCAALGRREWMLMVDADEVLTAGVKRDAVVLEDSIGRDSFFIQRNNLANEGCGGASAVASRSIERHVRLYRPRANLRWGGFIHEELASGTGWASSTSGSSRLVFDHYAEFKTAKDLYTKDALYSHMLLRAHRDPLLRQGTNSYWYDDFVPNHIDALTRKAAGFQIAPDASDP